MKNLFGDNRQANILSVLRKNSALNIEMLAQRFGVSERTVRNDIKDINRELKNSGLVEINQGKCSLRVFDTRDFQNAYARIIETDDLMNSSQKRQEYVFAKLMRAMEPVLTDDIAYEMNIGRSTLISDLKKLRQTMEKYELEIVGKTSKGLALGGSELNIRKFVMENLFGSIYQNYPQDELMLGKIREAMAEKNFEVKLLADAGLNAYRFSIEWARIEPEEGQFDPAEIEHYRKVIACCKAHGVEPVVTLLHFTSPKWLIAKGGWEAESTVEYFKRYAGYVMRQLGSELSYVCTINEANMGLQLAAISKRFRLMAEQAAKAAANAGKSAEGSVQVGMNFQKMMENMKYAAAENAAVFGTPQPKIFVSERTPEGDLLVLRAHAAARQAIKEICPRVKVGLTLSLHDLQAQPGGEAFAAAAWEEEFTHYLPYIKEDDFLGVQNYTRTLYGAQGQLPAPQGTELTQMNYEVYPQALENVIRKVAANFKGDLMVTENGIATADDTRRVAFIEAALAGVQNCIADGIPVKGYFHWSLMDNFEWQKGYAMNFGLIAVNRETMQRTPKPSLAALGGYANA